MKPSIRDYIGKYGSAQDDAKAYASAMSIYLNKSYTVIDSESQQFLSYWHKKGSSSSSSQQTGGGGGGVLGAVGGIQSFTETYGNPIKPVISPEDVTGFAGQLGSAFFGKQGGFIEGIKSSFSTIVTSVLKGGEDILRKEVETRNKLNSQIVIGGELSRQYRDNIRDASDAVAGMGYSMDDLIDSAINATKETGRFFIMSEKTLENMSQTSRAFIGDMREMGSIFRNFELVGVGAEKTLEAINEAGKSSLTLGLNAKTTTAQLTANIGKINQYGFENGTQGLNRMVQKSVEFRMNMQNVFDIADKVMSPEKAIDLAANLQVLGGAIGSLGDPYQMMYMATNNVEGLQDAIIGAAESLVTYNSEQGKFEISGVNLRRARALAEELGMSYQDLASTAIASAERTSVASDLITAGITVDDKQKEFITNLAKMGSGGKMVIEVPKNIADELGIQQTTALEELNQTTIDKILANQKMFEKMDVKDIALNQFTETQKLSLTVSEIAQMLKVEFARTYSTYGSKIDEYVKRGNDLLDGLKTGKDNEYSKEVDRLKSEQRKAAELEGSKSVQSFEKPKTVVVNKNQKGKPEENKALKVDNNKTETKEQPKTEDKTVSKEDLERILINVMTMNKNVNNGNFIIQNNIDETNPRSYTNVKSK